MPLKPIFFALIAVTLCPAASMDSCVPMRWISAEPASLRLLDGTPVNCLLLEARHAKPSLIEAAKKRGLTTLAVVREAGQTIGATDAIVIEGSVPRGEIDVMRGGKRPVMELTARRALRFDSKDPVIGTWQGVWPGTQQEHSGPKSSGPSGNAWINTNTGFLRFARSVTKAEFWLDNAPPAGVRHPVTRYQQAIADAASVGARWVITLDGEFAEALLARDEATIAEWKKIGAHLRFYEERREWRNWPPHAAATLVQDSTSGALITGNLLDMLSVMNTPVRAVPARTLTDASLAGSRLTITVHPQDYTPDQMALIRGFAAKGGKIVKGPDGFRMPDAVGERITFTKEEYSKLEAIWPELHLAVQRKNFGVRMFNVNGTLTYLQKSPDEKKRVLHLVNFTDFPVDAITAFVEGTYRKARLYTPEGPPRDLSLYSAPEGTAVEIDKVWVCGIVVLE